MQSPPQALSVLGNLPVDVTVYLFSFFPLERVGTDLRLVCRAWRQFIDQEFFRDLCVQRGLYQAHLVPANWTQCYFTSTRLIVRCVCRHDLRSELAPVCASVFASLVVLFVRECVRVRVRRARPGERWRDLMRHRCGVLLGPYHLNLVRNDSGAHKWEHWTGT